MNTTIRSKTGGTLLLLGILFIAANLRAPFTSLPPLLDPIRAAFSLSTLASGALTALPLLAFAVISPFSAPIARRYGLERTLFGALLIITCGIVLRSLTGMSGLFIGTLLIGVGIAIGNVLLPSLVKRDFAHNVTSVTGAYALIMGIAAALASAVITPLSNLWGWQHALLALLILPLIALCIWLKPLSNPVESNPSSSHAQPTEKLWANALAWQITLFLGLNSTIYYVIVGWLPTILTESGLSATEAGSYHGMMQLATAIPGLLLAPILRKMRDQRLAGVTVCLFSAIALLGFAYLPQWTWVWSLFFGLGTGAGIILGLSLIGLRTQHAQQAASLSGMSQCIGYLLASVGPMAIGALHDLQGNWQLPLLICALLALIGALMGWLAGRDRLL